jgi:hypothetical protein
LKENYAQPGHGASLEGISEAYRQNPTEDIHQASFGKAHLLQYHSALVRAQTSHEKSGPLHGSPGDIALIIFKAEIMPSRVISQI